MAFGSFAQWGMKPPWVALQNTPASGDMLWPLVEDYRDGAAWGNVIPGNEACRHGSGIHAELREDLPVVRIKAITTAHGLHLRVHHFLSLSCKRASSFKCRFLTLGATPSRIRATIPGANGPQNSAAPAGHAASPGTQAF